MSAQTRSTDIPAGRAAIGAVPVRAVAKLRKITDELSARLDATELEREVDAVLLFWRYSEGLTIPQCVARAQSLGGNWLRSEDQVKKLMARARKAAAYAKERAEGFSND